MALLSEKWRRSYTKIVKFFKNSVKTAVPEDGNAPGALVLTKLVEWYRFEVGDVFF